MTGGAATPRPLRCGVLGCADIAWRRTLPAMAATPGVEVAAVASRDGAKAARFAAAFDCEPIAGYDALLASPGIDAVYVPLPAMLHAEWVGKALRAGKHVLAEKPLTGDAESTGRLLRLADSLGLVLLENVAFPHHGQHAHVRKLLADGVIGDVRDFTSVFTIPPRPDGDIRYRPDVGGGALLDMGIYPIHAALYHLGSDVEVLHAVLRVRARTGAVVSGRILACTPAGATADLTFGMEHSYRTSCEFAGTTGRLLLDRAFTPPPGFQPVVRVERQNHREEFTLPADDQFANAVRYFAEAVRSGAGAAEYATAGLRQARLVGDVERTAVRIEVP
ncbi:MULTISPECIES: Gfo/Idh/MocA family protein [Streptomyces]|uniref:Gfo/Idh/MocA family protein n=1 Tax=Streptomyces TaxID=1883 RepID=UPI0022A992E3|nr:MULTISPECIES: Gfo/Idh/MocA family oxidoreductase [Streptomyces]UFQ18661.1 Gfo/Idh/MocA family oxidoreductase [Streptomyces huasconensis]WCL90010.1 Gfo/Idh/MocA family oxidoreductase [Streptomyces sp. JCM 35825]